MDGKPYRSCREAMKRIGLTKAERGRLRPLLRLRRCMRIYGHLFEVIEP